MALTLNGSTGISGIAGSAGTPALQGTDTNTGYFFGTDILGLSTGGSERFRIDSSGRLGIGDNNPQSLLSIYDSANANDTPLIRLNSFRPAIRFVDRSSSSTESEIVADGNSLRFRIGEESDNNTALPELMRLKSDGKLGLGTVSPDQKLEVYNGAIKIDRRDNADTGNPHLEMRTGSSGGSRLLIYGEDHTDDNSNWIYKTNSNEDHIFHTGSTERLRIASSGFVGIGTSSPLRKLHIHEPSAASAYLHLTNATTGSATTDGFSLYVATDGQTYYRARENTSTHRFYTGTTEKLHIDYSGRLGIGVTPKTWHSNNKAIIQGLGGYAILARSNNLLGIFQNFYYDANDAGKYIETGEASAYFQNDGNHIFYTAASGTGDASASFSEVLKVQADKNVKITDGDLVIGTSGHGIDFSATGDGSGTATSEVLDDYEEGTWTAALVTGTATHDKTTYRKIGSVVHIWGRLYSPSDTTSSNSVIVTGLPFAVADGTAVGSCMAKDVSNKETLTTFVNTAEHLYFYGIQNSNAWNSMLHSNFGANVEVYYHATYWTTA
jgi:hypothetical protein